MLGINLTIKRLWKLNINAGNNVHVMHTKFAYITSSLETCLNLGKIEKVIQSTMAKIIGLHI